MVGLMFLFTKPPVSFLAVKSQEIRVRVKRVRVIEARMNRNREVRTFWSLLDGLKRRGA